MTLDWRWCHNCQALFRRTFMDIAPRYVVSDKPMDSAFVDASEAKQMSASSSMSGQKTATEWGVTRC